MKTIVITGPSGSGKSFLSKIINKVFSNTIVISTDSYYRDDLIIKLLSFFLHDIYDRLISIKEKKILLTINSLIKKEKTTIFYNYDFKSKKSSKHLRFIKSQKNIRFIILEGIFAHRLELNYNNTINILCDQNKELCRNRRIRRDQLERGRNINEVSRKFNKSWYLYFKNLNNFKKQKKIITLRSDDNNVYKKLINNLENYNK